MYHAQLMGFAVKIIYVFYAHDIVADAFESLVAIEDQGNGKVRHFLFTKVRNDCFNRLKHERRAHKHHEIILAMSSEYIEAYEIKSELVALIVNEINKLPIAQRLVFKMRYIDDMSRKEVCEKLKIQLGTFDTHMMRAKQRIRSVFKDREV